MQDKVTININVLSILVLWVFFKLFWLLALRAIGVPAEFLSYTVLICFSLSIFLIIGLSITINPINNSSLDKFKFFLGSKPSFPSTIKIIFLIIPYFLIGIGSLGLLILIDANIDLGEAQDKWHSIIEYHESPKKSFLVIILSLFSKGLLGPIIEELVFRGLILKRLIQRNGVVFAVIISAVIFSLFHFNKSFIGVFVHGVILAVVAIKFRSIYYPIILHCLYNILGLFLSDVRGGLLLVDSQSIANISEWQTELLMLSIGSLMIILFRKFFLVLTRLRISGSYIARRYKI